MSDDPMRGEDGDAVAAAARAKTERERNAVKALLDTLDECGEIRLGDLIVYMEFDPTSQETEWVLDGPGEERRFATPDAAVNAMLADGGGA